MAHRKKLRKPIRIMILVIALTVLGTAGMFFYDKYRRENEKKALYDSMSLTVTEASVDCGSEADAADLLGLGEEAVVDGSVDTSTAGSYPVTVTLQKETARGDVVTRSFPATIEVVDNSVPEIVLKEDTLEIQKGSELDLQANIQSVTDGKDGDLAYAETETPGCYTIETDTDPETAGEYTASVTALDQDGHRVTEEFRIVVTDASASQFPYRIRINRELNTVTVYSLDADGNYSVPLKAMVCSTGPATPVGVFHTFNRGTWRALFGGVYGQYVTDIVGDILFHSVPYYSMNKWDLEYLEYNKLGTKASMGCIRLPVIDALWIFNNCPIGTEVEIYDDPSAPGPLGKPESIYIDPESEIRGWDPTDPDPENPWNY